MRLTDHAHTQHQQQNEAHAATALRDNKQQLSYWSTRAAYFHEVMRETQQVEVAERKRRITLGGSVHADRQWVVNQADDRHKQAVYAAEIAEIEAIIAQILKGLETCRSRSASSGGQKWLKSWPTMGSRNYFS